MKQQSDGADRLKHSIRRNSFLGLLIAGIGYLYPVIVFIHIARIFHPKGLGQISFASSMTAYFVMFTGLGMPIYGLRQSAMLQRKPGERSIFVAEMLLIRFLSGVIIWGMFLLTRQLMAGKWTGTERSLLMIYGVGILAAIPDCSWFYKGMEDYRSMAWISMGGRGFGLAIVLLLIRDVSDINKYAWIAVLIPLVISVIELILADRKWDLHVINRCGELIRSNKIISLIQKHIRPLGLFMLMSCAVTVYTHTDTVMLGLMQERQVVGLYSCATKIKSLLPVLTGTLWAAALPRSVDLWKNGRKKEFGDLSEKSFHIIYVVLLPLTVYFFLFAESWILLIGGEDYLDAVWTMRLLLLAVIPIGFSNIIGGQMLIPMGEEKKLFQAEIIGASANIILNAFLIPWFSLAGAAIATTISEILVTLITICATIKMVRFHFFQPRILLHGAAGCCVAGLLTIGIIRGLGFPPLVNSLMSFAIYVVFFGLMMLLMRDPMYRSLFMSIKKLYWQIIPESIRIPIGRARRKIWAMYYGIRMILFPSQLPFYCSCCETKLRSFVEGSYLEHPEMYDKSRYEYVRQDVICPVCGALPRHRILAEWCEAHKEELLAVNILYFAPETSMMCWMKRNGITCTTADLYAKADLKLDIQETGLPDDSQDIIFCNHVLEHVDDLHSALNEIYRILRSGGRLICSFPIDMNVDLIEEETKELSAEERILRFGQYDHKRVFGIHAYRILTDIGFTVETISGKDCQETILPVIGPADYDINLLFDCKKV